MIEYEPLSGLWVDGSFDCECGASPGDDEECPMHYQSGVPRVPDWSPKMAIEMRRAMTMDGKMIFFQMNKEGPKPSSVNPFLQKNRKPFR